MSGGSLDYIYCKVEEVAYELMNKNNTPSQRALGEHLVKVSKALHDVEWVMSGDYGEGDDEKAIQDVLNTDVSVIGVLKSEANEIIKQLEKYLNDSTL